MQHLGLRNGRKQEPEFDFIVPVLCMKPRLELMVAHQGEIRLVVKVARVGLQVVESPLLTNGTPKRSPVSVQSGRFARKTQIRGCVIAIHEKLMLAVDRYRFCDGRMKCLISAHALPFAVYIGFPFRPRNLFRPRVCLLAPLHFQIVSKHKWISVDDTRLRKKNGLVDIERIVPAEISAKG